MTQTNLIKAEERTSADVTTYTNTTLGQVRVIGDRDNPLFCLKDVCEVLEHTNHKVVKTSIINEFGKEVNQTYPLQTAGGIQQMLFITEPQLYFVLMRSDKPKAKAARKWFMDELIPSLKEVKMEAPVAEVIDSKEEFTDNSNITLFTNESLGSVRVVGDKDNPLFCLKDICIALEMENPSNIVKLLDNEFVDEDLYKIYPLRTNGGIQQMLFITESQLYFILMRSNKSKARPFRKWVVKEVLPSIRKTGSYSIGKAPTTYKEALLEIVAQIERNEMLEQKIIQDAPMTELGKAVSSSKDCINLGQLAVILKQNGVDIGRNKLFKYLRENGYLVNQRGKEHNRPTQKAMDLGLFEVQERVVVINNESCIKFTAMVTPKGQQYFIDLFLKQGS